MEVNDWLDYKTALLFEISTCLHGLEGEYSLAVHIPLPDGRIVVGKANDSKKKVDVETMYDVFYDAKILVRHVYKLLVFKTPFTIKLWENDYPHVITWTITSP